MDLVALLRTEAITARRNLGLIVVVLVLLPGGIVAGTAVFMRRSGSIGAGEATGRSGGLPVEVGGAIPACAPIPGAGHLGWALGFALLCNWLHFASNFCRQMGLLLLGTLVLWVVLCAAIVGANPAGDDSSSAR